PGSSRPFRKLCLSPSPQPPVPLERIPDLGSHDRILSQPDWILSSTPQEFTNWRGRRELFLPALPFDTAFPLGYVFPFAAGILAFLEIVLGECSWQKSTSVGRSRRLSRGRSFRSRRRGRS